MSNEVDANGKKDPQLTGHISSETLDALSDDVGSLWFSSSHRISVLNEPPSALTFLRDHVSVSRPCIIRNCIHSSDDAGRPLILTLDDLVSICSDCGKDDIELTVDVTPDGHGDCVRTVREGSSDERKRFFVKPEERTMSILQFREELRCGRDTYDDKRCGERGGCRTSIERDADGLAVHTLSNSEGENHHSDSKVPVLYYSRQNDCLRTELASLFELNLFPRSFGFAEDAFGTGPPDAVNLWIGDERAVSSMHKDHYENLFYVLSGEKIFTLCPPADAPFLHEGEFESGTFRCVKEGKWVVDPDYGINEDERGDTTNNNQRVRWIESDVERPGAFEQYPHLRKAHPIQIRVRQGEMLYLPALWYHRVTQSCKTVGLNYWFEMRFDSPSWCYFNMMQHMKVGNGSAAG